MPRKPVVSETVSLYQAKTQLSRLVDRPRARLVPLEDTRARRVPGRGKGQWRVGKTFDAPLPDAVLRDFDGFR